MHLEQRIAAFIQLGKSIRDLSEQELDILTTKVENNNNWFTPSQTRFALNEISGLLEEARLRDWLSHYIIPSGTRAKSIGLLLAGNIPAVGFHDFLCVLLSGHDVHAKLSSSDQILIPWLSETLISIEPLFSTKIFFEDMLKGKDAYIATGSDNSSRYFDYYFGKFPHIIRKNRTSIAVLDGMENEDDFQSLAHDIFDYFGLGCRNVSKVYLKNKEQLQDFLNDIKGFQLYLSHHKYLNNYDYNKAIYLVNGEDHLDNGFLLVKESKELVSPIAVLYYEIYPNSEVLMDNLQNFSSKIQCVVSKDGWYPGSVSFGQSQKPNLGDYADNVDTLKFLINL
jgi:hypothetical protein